MQKTFQFNSIQLGLRVSRQTEKRLIELFCDEIQTGKQ